MSQKPAMIGPQKSDGPIVPMKLPNNVVATTAEVVEGRGSAEGNTDEQNATRTQRRTTAQNALDRVREAARKDRKMKFTALLHHVTLERLRVAYSSLKRRAAPGVDGVTWAAYGEGLEARLADLHVRLQRGAYRAKPSRRVYIPKPDGRQRPLGIAALEDKIVQRALAASRVRSAYRSVAACVRTRVRSSTGRLQDRARRVRRRLRDRA